VKYLRKNQVKITETHRNRLQEVEGVSFDENQDAEEAVHMFPSFNENDEG
jgi:hypothetical protein